MKNMYDALLWGKRDPWCALSKHMIEVGACAMEFLLAESSACLLSSLCDWMNMPPKAVAATLAYICSLHDIGKAHPFFQIRDGADVLRWAQGGFKETGMRRASGFRHEAYGKGVLERIWREKGFRAKGWNILLAAVGIHHQGKGTNGGMKRVPGMWEDIQGELEELMRCLFEPETRLPDFRNQDALGVLITSVLIICDWVASSQEFGKDRPEADDEAHLRWARERGKAVLEAYGLISDRSCSFPMEADFCDFWPNIPPEGMRPLQAACQGDRIIMSLLTIIEAPMGEGKTEAALYLAGRLCAAFGKRGVYIALPTAATSNQMHERAKDMLGAHGFGPARLLHSGAWMLDDQTPDPGDINSEDGALAASWLRPLRRGMLCENAVGTVDQAMAAVLWVKYGMLRLKGLADKVLIIDEIHAYDEYMSAIIARLLDWCRVLSVPVILLSATLQQRQRMKYIRCYTNSDCPGNAAYPLITQVANDGALREIPIDGAFMNGQYHFIAQPCDGDARSVARIALDRAQRGGCLCVLMNTVARAQAVYESLKEAGEGDVMIFHARYRMIRRAEIERACVERFGKAGERPKRVILVCTQVVEQSLDVDFDAMITDIAPMDLLLQRAGRAHRHGWRLRPEGMERAEILVLTPDSGAPGDIERRYGASGAVYAPCVLWGTENCLGEGQIVRVPEDVRDCVERAYGYFDENAIAAYIKKQVADQADVNQALGSIFPKPCERGFFAEMDSEAAKIYLDDREEADTATQWAGSGGRSRTRNGRETVRIAFLPEDFGEIEAGREGAKNILAQSVSIPLTRELGNAIVELKKISEINSNKVLTDRIDYGTMEKDEMVGMNNPFIRDVLILRPQPDGTYRLGDVVFHADDECGIWWEVNQRT